jgi:hypothetical protein
MLDQRQAEFRASLCTATAHRYAAELFEYFGDGMIGRDTLRAGLIEISEGLTDGRCDLGGPVKVTVKAV